MFLGHYCLAVKAIDMEVGGGSEICLGCMQVGDADAVLAAPEVDFEIVPMEIGTQEAPLP